MYFKEFITESVEEEKLKHLEHAEDHVINAGHEGFSHAYSNLKDVHDKLTGKNNDTRVTVKYDGSPSIVFGKHPQTGKFFVGSKSVFNKNPKVNYTDADIEKNHGHAPGLVTKLKYALKHLPKITPSGVYQGDIMHTEGDVHETNGKVHFTPNTITYSTPKNSTHGKKALNSKIGVAVHTKYNGNDLENMKAEYAPKLNNFDEHKDIHLIHTQHDLQNISYSPEDQNKFKNHLINALNAYKKTPAEHYNSLEGHQIALKTYINHTVRTGTKPSVSGFVSHYKNSHIKKISAVKTSASKAQKRGQMDRDILHVKNNRKHFSNILKMHKELENAKNTITNALSSNTEFSHTINGKKVKPEGFVVVKNNRPTKFVHRAEFSAANFNKDKKL